MENGSKREWFYGTDGTADICVSHSAVEPSLTDIFMIFFLLILLNPFLQDFF